MLDILEVLLTIALLFVGCVSAFAAFFMIKDGDPAMHIAIAVIVALASLTSGVLLIINYNDRADQERASNVENTCKPFGGVANGRTYEERHAKVTDEYYAYVCKRGPRVVHITQ